MKIMREKKKLYNLKFDELKAKMIYINENLTTQSKNILFNARKFVKENGWKFAWSSRGTIFVKKTENSKAFLINAIEDLEKLQK